MKAITVENQTSSGLSKKSQRWKVFKNQKFLYMMSIPFVIWVFIFQYLPLWGWTMAFQNYKPGKGFLVRNGLDSSIFKPCLRTTTSTLCLEIR